MRTLIRSYINQYKQLPSKDKSLVRMVRHFRSWMKLQEGRSPLADGLPWITFDAIDFLKANLKSDMYVFEYGSGGSSAFFARRVKHVVSVEHDKDWFALVKSWMQKEGIQNWRGVFFAPEKTSGKLSDSDPAMYSTSDNKWAGHTFQSYVLTIEEFPEESFDLVSVDGRSRPSCIMHAVKKIKPGGFILVDNADRPNYQKAIKEHIEGKFTTLITAFGPTAYSREFTRTMICKKL